MILTIEIQDEFPLIGLVDCDDQSYTFLGNKNN